MLILTGALLVLATWTALASLVAVVGTPIAAFTHTGPLSVSDVRRGLWWGLLVTVVAVYFVNLAVPLRSAAAALALLTLPCWGAAVLGRQIRRRGWRSSMRWDGPAIVVAVAAGLAVAYLALAALGPVTNFDSGLYHLGAIRYAAEYSTIPGLANLYFPFGYANAGFPMAAALENGPWGLDGFRLLNGFVILLLAVDLVFRSRARRSAGFFVLLAGASVVFVPMVALSDYWVTSPSQDTTVLVVTVACSGLLAEALASRRFWVSEAAASGALAVMLVLLRPTMLAYSVVLLLVLVALRFRRAASGSPAFFRASLAVLGGGVLAAIAATLRDYLLSGWLQYPLSIFAFDVPWRAPDPVFERTATLGYHRNPDDLWNAAEGWDWVGRWLVALPRQWEAYMMAALLLASACALVIARVHGRTVRWRALTAAVAPSVVMSVVWWTLTPPSFRFAWGPLFTMGTVPLGWGLWRIARAGGGRRWTWIAALGMSGAVTLVSMYSLIARFDWNTLTEQREWHVGITVPYLVAPIAHPSTDEVNVSKGLTLRTPTESEQCWTVFPLCTPRPSADLHVRGPSLQDGFENSS